MSWLSSVFPWIKVLHIMAIIAWMGGLLYLPRLFVYHCGAEKGSDNAAMLEVMELRLLYFIMNPAMIAVFVFGGLLFMGHDEFNRSQALIHTHGSIHAQGSILTQGWVHTKHFLVAMMVLAHIMMSGWRKEFVAGTNQNSARFYRVANEVPTLLLICIVILVIVKPF